MKLMLLFSVMFQRPATFFATVEILFCNVIVYYSLNFSHCNNMTLSYRSKKQGSCLNWDNNYALI